VRGPPVPGVDMRCCAAVALLLLIGCGGADQEGFDRPAVEAAVLDYYDAETLSPDLTTIVDIYEEWCTETDITVIQYAVALDIDEHGAEAAAEKVLLWSVGCPGKADEVVAGIMALAP
jgi:hypothetical protein